MSTNENLVEFNLQYTDIFSEQIEEDFIILPSQSETEQESQSEEPLTKMVRKLPALQGPYNVFDEKEAGETNTHIQSNNDEGGSGNPLEINSDQIDKSDPQMLMCASVSQDDVTVVNILPDYEADERSVCTPAQHLGSLQMSQNPMLVPETVEDTVNEIPPSPGVYGSTPVIIPSSPTQEVENQNESLDCNVNNSQLIVFEFTDTPGSPFRNPVVKKKQSRENDNDSIPSFDLNSGNTLSSFHSDEKNQLSEPDIIVVDKEDLLTTVDSHVQKEPAQSENFGDNLLQSTLLDDDSSVRKKRKTKSSYKTKIQADNNSLPSLDVVENSRHDNRLYLHLPAPLSSQTLQGSPPIVIHSDTHLTQNEVPESQDLALRLSLTGNEVMDESKSQSAHVEPFHLSGVKTICEKKSDDIDDRVVLSSENHELSVIHIDSDEVSVPSSTDGQEMVNSQSIAVVESKDTESDPKFLNEQKGIDIGNHDDKNDNKEPEQDAACDTNSGSNSTNPAKRRSQSKSQEKSQSSGSDSMSHSEWKRARKRAIKMQAVNDNPLIKWEDELDAGNQPNTDTATEVSSNLFSDEFHLIVPKAATWSDTATVVAMETNDIESQMCSKQLCAENTFNRTSSADDTLKLTVTTSCNVGRDELMIESMQSDTEVSQSVFKLEKPQIEDSTLQDESEPISFNLSKSNRRKRQARFILEDSDDEDVLSTGDKVPSVGPHLSEETDKEENKEILVATKLDTSIISQVEMGDKQDSVTMETDCCKNNEIEPVVTNKDRGHRTLIDSEDECGSKEKPDKTGTDSDKTGTHSDKTSTRSDKTGSHEEVFVPENVAMESNEMTQTYDPNVVMETKEDESTKKESIDNSSKSRLIEHSTQTVEDKQNDELERMAVNVTQKVVEYLQTGCSPRSRSSCIDNSDSYKTPNSKKTDGTKSPKELQDVLKTYSDILNKKHRSRNKSGSDKSVPNSQHPNPAANDSVRTGKDSLRRRLSTQSLPPSNSAETNSNVLKRQFSHSVGSPHDNKPPRKKVCRHSVDNYYLDKSHDEINTPKKNVFTELYPRSEKTDLVSESPGYNCVKKHDNKSNIHTVDVYGSVSSPDQLNKKSVCDNEDVQRTRLKSKSDISLSAEDKDWLTSNRVETSSSAPGKVKRNVSSDYAVEAVLDKTKEKHGNSKSLKTKRSLDVKKENIQNGGKSLNTRTVSGSFVSSTQTFPVSKETSHITDADDPYQFRGSQSQTMLDEVCKSLRPRSTPPTKHMEVHPNEEVSQKTNNKLEITDKNVNKQEDNGIVMTSQTSIVTATTIGSSPHLPTSSSQSNAGRENVLSQRSSSSECSVSANYHRKSQLKQSLSDALSNTNQMVTVVTETVERVYTEIMTIRKVIGPQGNVIESSESVQRLDPVVVKENTTKKYYPSSSFDIGATLTSDDLPMETNSPPSKSKGSNEEQIISQTKSSESNVDTRPDTDSPNQDQSVSSSHSLDVSMVTSDGTIGSRVLSKWKDGFYYPGCLKSSADRYSKYQILFDDGDSLMVKCADILLIERLPVGQSVMVLSEDGLFEYGIITSVQSDTYTIETDDGKSGTYTFNKVILSSDQASCILSDNGSKVTMLCHSASGPQVNYGNVSLDNLVDASRRSAKKPVRENKHKAVLSKRRI